MLELLMQAAAVQPPAAAGLSFETSAAYDWRRLAADAADAGGRTAVMVEAVKAEAVKAEAEDAMFDQFFFETLQLPLPSATSPPVDDDFLLVGDIGLDNGIDTDELLQDLLFDGSPDGDYCPMLEESAAPAAVVAADVPDEDDCDDVKYDGVESSSPASFEPTSPTPSSSASTSASSRRSSSASATSPAVLVAGGGRVQKKKEANREAAYRYRMKQRLDDSATDQRRAELQSLSDGLAGRVRGAESEAQFLLQMCRQIFSSSSLSPFLAPLCPPPLLPSVSLSRASSSVAAQ